MVNAWINAGLSFGLSVVVGHDDNLMAFKLLAYALANSCEIVAVHRAYNRAARELVKRSSGCVALADYNRLV